MSADAERNRPAGASRPDQAAGTVTDPAAADPRLRGRTYAIPFARVWDVALGLAHGGLGGWTVAHSDDREGVIKAQCRVLLRKERDLIVLRVGLDENAQTRVDLHCTREDGGGSARRHARVVDRFCRELDRKLGAAATHILDPTRGAPWMEGEAR